MNIFILDKNYNQIGMLSNEGANPQAPYFDDLYTQELDTGADTFYFTTLSTSASRDFIEIGNHIIFQFNNRHRLFAISDLEFEHKEGRNVIGVYAEGVGFQLLETFMGEFEGGDDTDGDGEVDNNSGEFLTYDMFLEKVLKDTDWNYQIMSGDLTNINMGKEVTFQNGKNIYALLQDSMQEFGGIELEFRAEYVGGSLNKTIYAYPHKGRGSFVGQRFEYGHNVAGIKKKQEIIDGLDENIILYEGLETVDGLNVEVTYEVDFALRDYEVEELEIGDTHYVIDNDFEPAQIEARIGKIEISFSDPTRNKCYIANFKKISGSKPDNIDSDNIEDIVDDNLDDKLDELLEEKLGENFGEHTHDRLVLEENDSYQVHLTKNDVPCLLPSTDDFRLGIDTNRWYDIWSRFATLSDEMIITSDGSGDIGTYKDTSIELRQESGYGFTNLIESKRITITTDDDKNRWLSLGLDNMLLNSGISRSIITPAKIETVRMLASDYHTDFDASSMATTALIGDNSAINKKDLLNFILNDVKLYDLEYDTIKKLDPDGEEKYIGIVHSDYFNGHKVSPVGERIFRCMIPRNDTNSDGTVDTKDEHVHTYNSNALVCALIGAFQQHVENGGEDGSNIDLSNYATKKDVEDAIDDIELTPGPKGDKGEDGVSVTNVSINSSNHLITTLSDNRTIDAGALPSGTNDGGELPSDIFEVIDGELVIKLPVGFDHSVNFRQCDITEGGADRCKLTGASLVETYVLECSYFYPHGNSNGEIYMYGNLNIEEDMIFSDMNSKIRLKDEESGIDKSITIMELIGAVQYGPVATVSEDLLDEQQNTIQQQQETIASLEARIARLEEMLGINN